MAYTKRGPWPGSPQVSDEVLFTHFDTGIDEAHDIAEAAQNTAGSAQNAASAAQSTASGKADAEHGHAGTEISYDNAASGLAAADTQAAIDAVAGSSGVGAATQGSAGIVKHATPQKLQDEEPGNFVPTAEILGPEITRRLESRKALLARAFLNNSTGALNAATNSSWRNVSELELAETSDGVGLEGSGQDLEWDGVAADFIARRPGWYVATCAPAFDGTTVEDGQTYRAAVSKNGSMHRPVIGVHASSFRFFHLNGSTKLYLAAGEHVGMMVTTGSSTAPSLGTLTYFEVEWVGA